MALGTAKQTLSHEIDATEEDYMNTDNVSKFKNENKPMITDNDNNNKKYFFPGPNSNNDKRDTIEITLQLQRQFRHVFNRIGNFIGTFLLQVKPDRKPY